MARHPPPARGTPPHPASSPEPPGPDHASHRPPPDLWVRVATRTVPESRPGTGPAPEPPAPAAPPPVQAKLAVSTPGDGDERQADRVAERVAEGGEAEELAGGTADPPRAGVRIRGTEAGGEPLPPGARARLEPRFRRPLGHVRVHTGARAADAARSVGARAFTVGRDIVFGRGEYAPESGAGERLLAHELTHVLQQQAGGQARVQRWALPTDWLDYIGLAIDVGERIYIELAYDEGQEKDFQRFVNTLFFAIDLILAALPGAGGGGVAVRVSHSGAVLAWQSVPDSAKVKVAEEVAKQMGWSAAKATQMINAYFRSAGSGKSGGGGKSSGGGTSGGGGTPGPSGKVSTEKYLEARWDKATFGSVWKSIEYHVAKHGKGLSAVEYTQRAEKAFADATAVRSSMADIQGREAVKVVSETFGSGLFTPHGRIIWFHPKL